MGTPEGQILPEEELLPVLQELRGEGLSFQKIADELESRGILTRLGKPKWNKRTIQRYLEGKEGES